MSWICVFRSYRRSCCCSHSNREETQETAFFWDKSFHSASPTNKIDQVCIFCNVFHQTIYHETIYLLCLSLYGDSFLRLAWTKEVFFKNNFIQLVTFSTHQVIQIICKFLLLSEVDAIFFDFSSLLKEKGSFNMQDK